VETFHAMLVFLALRGLGKVQAFARDLPKHERSPEQVVLYLIKEIPSVVPSMQRLSPDMTTLVTNCLKTHSKFNLAQMLQGENIPSHIWVLQECIAEQGEELLKFYLVALVGIMCGIRGAETLSGSLFMDEKNGRNVMTGIKCLRQMGQASPHSIYWNYICSRGTYLGMQTGTPEELAMTRLAALIRATPADLETLQGSWMSISRSEREILTDHFLADGIQDIAFQFVFLPLYFANARTNASVGLRRSLLVLVELVELLNSEGWAQQSGEMTIRVDLSDLAAFARQVKSPRIFEAVTGQLHFTMTGAEVRVGVSTQHWHRVDKTNRTDETMNDFIHLLSQVARKTTALESAVERVDAASKPCVGPCTPMRVSLTAV